MKTGLIILSSLLTIAAAIPYIIEVVQRKTKPRIVTWFVWSLLTGIACAATLADGQTASGILMFVATLSTGSIVLLGFRYGNRKVERFDAYCLAGAIVGLVLWQLFDSPEIAVLATVTVDIIGALPTLKHSWQKPHEETAITFLLSGLGGLATVLALETWTITSAVYPIYIFLMSTLLGVVVLRSPHRKLPGEAADLREL